MSTPATPAHPANSEILSRPNVVTFKTADIEPPSAIYLDLNDQLQIVAQLNPFSPAFTVRARIQRVDGQITVFEQSFQQGTSTTTLTLTFPVCEGFLLSIVAISAVAQTNVLPPFVTASIIRNGNTGQSVTMSLLADYVSINHPIGWTAAGYTPRYAGPGFYILAPPVVLPGAGQDFTVTPPNGQIWRIASIVAVLVTSAAVATRQVTCQIASGSSVSFTMQAAASQAASLGLAYVWTPGLTTYQLIGTQVFQPLPTDVELQNPTAFKTITTNLQGGDQWGQITIAYRGRYND